MTLFKTMTLAAVVAASSSAEELNCTELSTFNGTLIPLTAPDCEHPPCTGTVWTLSNCAIHTRMLSFTTSENASLELRFENVSLTGEKLTRYSSGVLISGPSDKPVENLKVYFGGGSKIDAVAWGLTVYARKGARNVEIDVAGPETTVRVANPTGSAGYAAGMIVGPGYAAENVQIKIRDGASAQSAVKGGRRAVAAGIIPALHSAHGEPGPVAKNESSLELTNVTIGIESGASVTVSDVEPDTNNVCVVAAVGVAVGTSNYTDEMIGGSAVLRARDVSIYNDGGVISASAVSPEVGGMAMAAMGIAVGVGEGVTTTVDTQNVNFKESNGGSSVVSATGGMDHSAVGRAVVSGGIVGRSASGDVTTSVSGIITGDPDPVAVPPVNPTAPTPTTTSTTTSQPPVVTTGSTGTEGWVIAVAVVGGVLGLGLIGALIFVMITKKRRQQSGSDPKVEQQSGPIAGEREMDSVQDYQEMEMDDM